MNQFLSEHIYSLVHWPFLVMVGVFWVIGHFMEKSVFTKWRSEHQKPGWLWWWGRESMELHPVLAGVVVGLIWSDPESAGWGWQASAGYFAGAGFLSLFFWKILHLVFKRFGGGSITLPGESNPPEK